MLRKGIRSTLDREWEICGEAASGVEALKMAAALKPDLVLMDVSMPEMNGIEATKQILKTAADIKVVIFTMHNSPSMVDVAKLAGAKACLTKTISAEELRRAITEVLNVDGRDG